MAVEVHWQVDSAPLDDAEVIRAVEAALDQGGRSGIAISVVLVDDPTLAEMHGRFLGDPTPTDVMSFDLGPGTIAEGGEAGEGIDDGPLGELFVSVERALIVARERQVSPARELALYLVHGVLHLCGFDDHEPEDRARMRSAERDVLDRLGYEPDFGPHE